MRDEKTVKDLLKQAKKALDEVTNAKSAEAVFIEYLGKKGLFKEKLRKLSGLPKNQRAKAGRNLHQAIEILTKEVERKLQQMVKEESKRALLNEYLDVTIPGTKVERGTLHPLTLIYRRAEKIFGSLGFSIAEGPEIEDEWHNFDALNIPPLHPARDLWDTFWLKDFGDKTRAPQNRLLLRTHTSPVQICFMEKNNPPFRIIVPGEVYRHEATDASHEFQFLQLEGFMVDYKDVASPVTMATLVSILKVFFEKFFRKTIALRVRPAFFPFVEPGIEIDLSCIVCMGRGCSVCSKTGWVEMLGAGMIHPKVFENVGYNPKQVQGFAFGFGLDRLAMLQYRIPDIRLFRSGGLAFLKQFKS